jgi:hypothetical protein
MAEATRLIAGQASWLLESDQVRLAVTVKGGQMAPVSFLRGSGKAVEPYYLNPWRAEGLRTGLPLLDVLRGDFFCLPFGAENKYRGEDHPPHGESANASWRLQGRERGPERTTLKLGLSVRSRPGTLTKKVTLARGQNAVYLRHELAGFRGRMCFSHHAILAVPDEPGGLRLSSSPFRLGMTCPRVELANIGREYYSLEPGSRFRSLSRVPTIWKDAPYDDCSTFPRSYGFMDLAAVFARLERFPAWVAAVVPSGGYLWYALKDPAVQPQLVLWMDNGGRQGAPWGGRNRCLGVEDGCAFFGEGLAASARANALNRQGIPTFVNLQADKLFAVNYIQGVVRIPPGFERVRSVRFPPGRAVFVGEGGRATEAWVRWEFLRSGAL